jgi:hypothetical protein
MLWWIGGASNKAPPPFGNVFENKKAVGDEFFSSLLFTGEIQNSKLKNGDFWGISIVINRKNKEK